MVTQLPRMVRRADRTYRLESDFEDGSTQPYKVTVNYGFDKREEMIEWCGERYGRHTKQWNNPRWRHDQWKNIFWFRNARDRTMFLMRWS